MDNCKFNNQQVLNKFYIRLSYWHAKWQVSLSKIGETQSDQRPHCSPPPLTVSHFLQVLLSFIVDSKKSLPNLVEISTRTNGNLVKPLEFHNVMTSTYTMKEATLVNPTKGITRHVVINFDIIYGWQKGLEFQHPKLLSQVAGAP